MAGGISGKHIAVTIGSAPVTLVGVQMWSAEDHVQELDGATAADLGFEHPYPGLQGVTVSMQLVIDITVGSLTTLQAGLTLTNLYLYANLGAALPIYAIPTALVTRSVPRGQVNERFTYDVTARSVGSYTLNNPN